MKNITKILSKIDRNAVLDTFFPFRHWGTILSKESLHADVLAAITNAIVVLPQGIAFAAIAGLPPQYGLYTAMVTPVIAALFGSSWHLISGPTTAISIVIFSTISGLHEPGSQEYIQTVISITFLAGLIQLFLGAVQLGQLVSLVSHSVMVGFTAGAAILIALSQFSGFLGRSLPRPEDVEAFLPALVEAMPHIDGYVFAVALGTLVITVLCKIVLPKWPNYLVGLVFGSLLAYFIDASAHGVQFVQPVETSIPPFAVPAFSLEGVRTLSTGAFALALIGLLEAVSIARAITVKSRQSLNNNQEIIGQGLSNIGGAFFSAYLGSGSFTRSGLNYEAGARTPVAAILAAVFLFIILMFVTPYIRYIPIPAMSGLIIVVAWKLISFGEIRHILRSSFSDSLILVSTFVFVLAVSLEFAVYSGVILSLAIFVRRSMRPGLPLNAPNPDILGRPFMNAEMWNLAVCPQGSLARLQGSLYFGAVEHLEKSFRRMEKERPGQKHLGIMLDGAAGMDLAGADLLINEGRRREARGGGLYLAVRYPPLRRQVAQFQVLRFLGRNHIFRRKREMIPHMIEQMDPEVCRTCKTRIFLECPVEKLSPKGVEMD